MKMKKESRSCREGVIASIEVLASPSVQLKYELDVPIAQVPFEVVYGFENVIRFKSEVFVNAFTEQELKSLAELYGMCCIADRAIKDCHSMVEVHKVPEWRSVMNFAKDLVVELKRSS